MAVHYFWDPVEDNIIEEYDDNGNVIAEYTTEPGLHGAVISEHRNGVSRFHIRDGDGNTVALTDEQGNVTDTFAYTAGGELTERTGTTPTPYQYKSEYGYYTDQTTGQIMVRPVLLDPSEGRLLSPGNARGATLNFYVYENLTGIEPSLAGMTGLAFVAAVEPIGDDVKKDLRGCYCRAAVRDLRTRPIPPEAFGMVRCFDNEWVVWINPNRKPLHPRYDECGYLKCTHEHEEYHIEQAKVFCPTACGNLVCGLDRDTPEPWFWALTWSSKECLRKSECWAHIFGLRCMVKVYEENKKKQNRCDGVGELALREALKVAVELYKCDIPKELSDEIHRIID